MVSKASGERRTELRAVSRSLPMQLLKAREATMEHFRPMLRRFGLTDQQWRVIRVLATHPAIDAKELAHRSLILPPSLTRIVKNLEADGLVRRRPGAADQRRVQLSLSAAGRERYDAVVPSSEAIYRAIEGRFGSGKLEALLDLLTDLNETLDPHRKTTPLC